MNGPRVLELVQNREPRLGTTRLLCIDGPAGSGKSTLAAEVVALTGAPVVHLDDLYPGWSGLFAVEKAVNDLLTPLAEDSPGHYRRYDWNREDYAETRTVGPAPLLILEGVGSGRRLWQRWTSALVWVETDDRTRLERGLARDGLEVRDRWTTWMDDEAVLFAREDARTRADLVIAT